MQHARNKLYLIFHVFVMGCACQLFIKENDDDDDELHMKPRHYPMN